MYLVRHPVSLFVFCSFLLLTISLQVAGQGGGVADSVRLATQQRLGLKAEVPLSARLSSPTEEVLTLFREAGMSPVDHTLSEVELKKVKAALEQLPPLHQQVLKERLRHISFLDSMPNTALTSTVNPGDPFPVFDITIRAEIVGQDVSAWMNQKEQTLYRKDSSAYSVTIDAGHLDAIFYVLLHETTHIIDGTFRQSKIGWQKDLVQGFADGVWSDRTVVAAVYHHSLLDSIAYRRTGRPLRADSSMALYRALSRSPFVSLYGSASWSEDLAEFVAVYHFTQRLRQPFSITVRKGRKKVFFYEPMRSALVRGRMNKLLAFYALS